MIRSITSAGALSYAVFAAADAVYVEFDENLTNDTTTAEARWTYPGKFIYGKTADAYYFSAAANDFVRSPEFPFAITGVTFTISRTSTRVVKVAPVFNGSRSTDAGLTHTVSPEGTEKTQTACAWSIDDDVHAIAIYSDAGGGNAYLYSAEIHGAAVPYHLTNGAIYRNAFEARYTLPAAIPPSQLEFSVNALINHPGEYDACDSWYFTEENNVSGNPEYVDPDEFAASYPGLIADTVQIAARTNGLVQIGNSRKLGSITIVNPPDGATVLILKASKPATEGYGRTMPISYLDFGTTNVVTNLTLTTSFQDHVVDIGGLQGKFPIIINSTIDHAAAHDKQSTVNLRSIVLARNYRPPYSEMVPAGFHAHRKVTATNAFLVTDSHGTFVWRARCRHSGKDASPFSAPCEVTLPTDAPRLVNVYGMILFVR